MREKREPMENDNVLVELTRVQLDYLCELITQDVALSLMTLGKLSNQTLKDRLQFRINTNKMLLNQLKAFKNNEYS